ncbi:Cyclin-A2-2 [Bienertia sinuspersici]
MTKNEWKFLVDHWSDDKFKKRARKQRKTNDEKCSRVDVLVASHTRKSKTADEIKKLKEQRDQGLSDKTDEQIFQDVLAKEVNKPNKEAKAVRNDVDINI